MMNPYLDLWVAPVEAIPLAELTTRYMRLLSPDERDAFDRHAVEADRHAYLVAHVLLRVALSHYGGVAPDTWQFTRLPGGKPRLRDVPSHVPQFSISHTRGMVVCACASHGPVGVDVESASRGHEVWEVAEKRFRRDEQRALDALPRDERFTRALWMWTAKEAVLKATGEGLAAPLDHTPLRWDANGRLRLAPQADVAALEWELIRFRIAGYLGTAAVHATSGNSVPIRVVRVRGANLDLEHMPAAPVGDVDGLLEIPV